jgi:DUF2075 family protein
MNRPPFGYRVMGRDVIVDSDSKDVVVNIFEDYFDNVPIKRIAREVDKSPGSVRYILKNRFYVDCKLNGDHEVFIDVIKFERAQIKLNISKEFSTKR